MAGLCVLQLKLSFLLKVFCPIRCFDQSFDLVLKRLATPVQCNHKVTLSNLNFSFVKVQADNANFCNLWFYLAIFTNYWLLHSMVVNKLTADSRKVEVWNYQLLNLKQLEALLNLNLFHQGSEYVSSLKMKPIFF